MARAYEGGSCLCGGIFGTGTNGAYVEKLSKITKMAPGETDEEMVVNTECESRCEGATRGGADVGIPRRGSVR